MISPLQRQTWLGLKCTTNDASNCYWDSGVSAAGYNNFAPGNEEIKCGKHVMIIENFQLNLVKN